MLDEAEGLKATDSSGHGNEGRVIRAVWREIDGKRAAYFDGRGSSIEIKHVESLAIEQDITIAAWIWKEAPNQGERWDAIVSKTPTTCDYELLTSKALSDEPAFFSPRCEPNEVYAGREVPSREWTHLAVTRRDSEVTFYMNGDPVGTAEMSGPFLKSGGVLQIGHDGPSMSRSRRGWRSLRRAAGNGGMIGGISGVAIYNRALAQNDIARLRDETIG